MACWLALAKALVLLQRPYLTRVPQLQGHYQ